MRGAEMHKVSQDGRGRALRLGWDIVATLSLCLLHADSEWLRDTEFRTLPALAGEWGVPTGLSIKGRERVRRRLKIIGEELAGVDLPVDLGCQPTPPSKKSHGCSPRKKNRNPKEGLSADSSVALVS